MHRSYKNLTECIVKQVRKVSNQYTAEGDQQKFDSNTGKIFLKG